MTNPSAADSEAKKALVQDYFSRTAESYVASFSHRAGDDLQQLIALGEWHPQQSALDIATGGGHTALAVAPHVAYITVTDLTPPMLEKARSFILSQGITNASFVIADAEALPFLDASFDRVTCRIAAHHFPNVLQATHEVARVLKPGGIFLLIDCIAPSPPELDTFDNTIEKWRDHSHGRSCTVEEWHSFFQQVGLQVEHTEFFRKAHQFDDWTTRSQMPANEKAALENYMLTSDSAIQQFFEVTQHSNGHIATFTSNFILLKGRKLVKISRG